MAGSKFNYSLGITVVLSIVFGFGETTQTPSGLYRDDGKGHTVLQQKFSKQDVREISYDILNIMGFHHRPHPHLVDSRSPASKFLIEVYDSIATGSQFDLDVDLSNGENGRKQDWRKSQQRHYPRAANPVPKNLSWSEFNVDQSDIDAIQKADEIISFVNRGHRFSDRLKQYSTEKQFWFDVTELSPHDDVYGAELRIWKKGKIGREVSDDVSSTDPASELIRISVYQISPGSDVRSFEETELDEIMTATWEQGWLRLNVTRAFRYWIKRPTHNFGLVISTKSADSGIEIPWSKTGLASIEEKEEHQPFLVAFLKTSDITKEELKARQSTQAHESRVRRSAAANAAGTGSGPTGSGTGSSNAGGSNTAGGGGGGNGGGGKRRNKKSKKAGRHYDFQDVLERPKSCQMGMLYVNFEDLGWKDWVIAPDGFIAYYCHGECSFPLTASMNATNHAIVSTLVHTYYPLEYPKPSCAPVKLGSISMLYYDDNSNVTVKKYKDMVIKSCGCK